MQRFKSTKQNVFSSEVNKNALCANDHKRMKSISSIESYSYRRNKDLLYKNEDIK